MGKKSKPRRGSLAYSPRVRAARPYARVRAWPEREEVGLRGTMGYKTGMTQVFMIDDRRGSPTSGQEIAVPATVLETPPVLVCAVRLYGDSAKGLRALTEIWAPGLPKELSRKIRAVRKQGEPDFSKAQKLVEDGKVRELSVIASTQPWKTNLPKRRPELAEIRVGGGSIGERWEYSKSILGKEVKVSEIFREGEFVDVLAITKGKGFQGPVKRWGIKILPRKTRKGRRQVGAIGPWSPARIMWTVPAAGQLGYHQRTELNKRILKIGSDGSEVTPKGGFLRYGPIQTDYLLIAGSTPGTAKRLVHVRHSIRLRLKEVKQPILTHVSVVSQQGV
jgi:large subunit ribosomal protein L3